MNSENNIVITTFYHFIDLPHFEEMKEPLLSFCKEIDLKGTILLAKEGINATISGSRKAIDMFYKHIAEDLNIPITNFKESYAEFKPFERMRVRLKKEIVAMGVFDLDTEKYSGQYINSNDWDELIAREDVVVIDTRNRYEVKLGTFKNAINPNTRYFKQFPAWAEENKELLKDKKIAMFCTGGIRCEKSTAFLRRQGYEEVYHLEGGILKYLEDTNNKSQMWQGNCFVFDERVAVTNNLSISGDVICTKCSYPMTTDDVRETAHLKKVICIKCNNLNLKN